MIKIIQGDITTLAVDAIVNAANQMMLIGPSDFDPVIKYCADKRHIMDIPPCKDRWHGRC